MLALLLVSGCGIDTDSFDGWYAHIDDGTVRAFNFFDEALPAAQTRDEYELFVYADAPGPLQNGTAEWTAARDQWGTYVYEDGVLVTSPIYSRDEALVGQALSHEVLSFGGAGFELMDADGETRLYEPISEVP